MWLFTASPAILTSVYQEQSSPSKSHLLPPFWVLISAELKEIDMIRDAEQQTPTFWSLCTHFCIFGSITSSANTNATILTLFQMRCTIKATDTSQFKLYFTEHVTASLLFTLRTSYFKNISEYKRLYLVFWQSQSFAFKLPSSYAQLRKVTDAGWNIPQTHSCSGKCVEDNI